MPSPGEQEGADEKPAEGTQADPSGVREYFLLLYSDSSTEPTAASVQCLFESTLHLI